MKKNAQFIIVAIVALAIGYFLGSNFGAGNSNETKGDINAVNHYHEFLADPSDMAFNENASTDQEAIQRTIKTMQIIELRLKEFNTLTQLMNAIQSSDPTLASAEKEFISTNQKSQKAAGQASEALAAANQLQAGNKIDLKKALKNATAAYNQINQQLAMGKEFVKTADAYLKGKDIKENIMLATIRDLVATHCAVNASITQNDSEIDYWSNQSGLVKSTDMAATIE